MIGAAAGSADAETAGVFGREAASGHPFLVPAMMDGRLGPALGHLVRGRNFHILGSISCGSPGDNRIGFVGRHA